MASRPRSPTRSARTSATRCAASRGSSRPRRARAARSTRTATSSCARSKRRRTPCGASPSSRSGVQRRRRSTRPPRRGSSREENQPPSRLRRIKSRCTKHTQPPVLPCAVNLPSVSASSSSPASLSSHRVLVLCLILVVTLCPCTTVYCSERSETTKRVRRYESYAHTARAAPSVSRSLCRQKRKTVPSCGGGAGPPALGSPARRCLVSGKSSGPKTRARFALSGDESAATRRIRASRARNAASRCGSLIRGASATPRPHDSASSRHALLAWSTAAASALSKKTRTPDGASAARAYGEDETYCSKVPVGSVMSRRHVAEKAP
mmetsp:Transcript_806/g.3201  ORF Transcript_806/g.3201 Transcript_806/m.3201 type:complete len:322 (-) Transcript_806:376-1341(-)